MGRNAGQAHQGTPARSKQGATRDCRSYSRTVAILTISCIVSLSEPGLISNTDNLPILFFQRGRAGDGEERERALGFG
jgi:hypothetical protein